MDSLLFTLPKFYIIFILSPISFPLCFLSHFLSPDYWVWTGPLWYLQPTKPDYEAAILFIYSLASIHFSLASSKQNQSYGEPPLTLPMFLSFLFCFPLHTYLLFVWFSVPFWLLSYMWSPTGFSQTPPTQTTFSYILLWDHVLLLPLIFFIRTHKTIEK